DARADGAGLGDAVDDVVGRADPDVVVLYQLLERDLGELLHDPRGVEAVARLAERVRGRLLVLEERRAVPVDEPRNPVARLPERRLAILVQVAGVDPDDVGSGAVLLALGPVEVEL